MTLAVRSTLDVLLNTVEVQCTHSTANQIISTENLNVRKVGGGRKGAAHRKKNDTVRKMQVITDYEALTSAGKPIEVATKSVALAYGINRSMVRTHYTPCDVLF